ncbi:MAG: glycosyltransferase [Planctomycetes bacterium]|nr:glycosyltransferase [Planctomycetota bacterium]
MDILQQYILFCLNYLTDLTPAKLLEMYMPCILLDTPRYVISKYLLFIWERILEIKNAIIPPPDPTDHMYAPFVSIIIPGLNEEEGMIHTIRSLLENKYHKKELIVVDDGSNDRTFEVCLPYAERGKIRLFRKNVPGGKTSAANLGLSVAKGEIIIIVDSDTSFDSDSITRIIRPFHDRTVGAVAGNIRVRNWRASLLARYQAAEYLHCIFLGRRLHSALGTLNIASGAFGAFRTSAVKAVGGWDVGPGEDGDLTTKIRKRGYRVVFIPEAVCLTDVPTTVRGFIKQRLRWSRGVIRYRLRKHLDMANPFSSNFRISNLAVIMDSLFFRVFLPFSFLVYFTYMLAYRAPLIPLVMGLTWIIYGVLNLLQIPLVLYYSDRKWEDAKILLATFIMSPYNILHRVVRLISMTQEIFWRMSFHDPYVPKRVREQTIKW